MNTRFFQIHDFSIQADKKLEPAWAAKVDRWYQLDGPSFVMAELAYRLQTEPSPLALFLSGKEASSLADIDFVNSGASSPAKFVYTLPSVRSSSFCQVLSWTGPVWSIQKDPESCLSALQESLLFDGSWVIDLRIHADHIRARCFLSQVEASGAKLKMLQKSSGISASDEEFFRWLEKPQTQWQRGGLCVEPHKKNL